jgi:phage gpG-like protein
MQVEAKFDNITLLKAYDAMSSKIDEAVKLAVQTVSGEAKREVTGNLGLSQYGRHARGTPTPSPPGMPPAQVTTRLRKSITIQHIVRVGFAHYRQVTEPTVMYAAAQEFGIPGRLPARPFMSPALARLQDDRRAERIFTARMKQVIYGLK